MLITLLTDFGGSDTYVGQMKGVIWGINPQALIVDLTHEIPPQNVPLAASLLARSLDAFPPGTIHVAVVDPGVGSDRPLIALEAGSQRFLAPDNGLLSRVFDRCSGARSVELNNSRFWRKSVSATFHGRDILAPVAAHWSLGETALTELGTERPIESLLRLSTPRIERTAQATSGIIEAIDRFGNLLTNLHSRHLPADNPAALTVQIGGRALTGLRRCYSDVAPGELLALLDNVGHLEVAINRGNAAEFLSCSIGDVVTVVTSSETAPSESRSGSRGH